MRIVRYYKKSIELRWTWMPYWLAVSPIFINDIESLVKDAIVLNGVTGEEATLDKLEAFVHKQLAVTFPIPGLVEYLKGMAHIPE
jgi:hypothetical protein